MRTIGEQVREYLEGAGMTQETLASRVGRDVSTISRWLRGEHDPRSDDLHKIAHAIGQPLMLRFGPEAELEPVAAAELPPWWTLALETLRHEETAPRWVQGAVGTAVDQVVERITAPQDGEAVDRMVAALAPVIRRLWETLPPPQGGGAPRTAGQAGQK